MKLHLNLYCSIFNCSTSIVVLALIDFLLEQKDLFINRYSTQEQSLTILEDYKQSMME